MFEASQRHNFLDLLRPPAGYRLEAAVGTTYSLDFIALTATLLAFVDAEAEADQNSTTSTVESLHAITRLTDRVRVFVNRGQIAGPRKVSRVTTLYDHIVLDVCLASGCFHPKVWVAHYLVHHVLQQNNPASLLGHLERAMGMWSGSPGVNKRTQAGRISDCFATRSGFRVSSRKCRNT